MAARKPAKDDTTATAVDAPEVDESPQTTATAVDAPEVDESPQTTPAAGKPVDGSLLSLPGSAATLAAWENSPEGKRFIENAEKADEKQE